MTGLAAAMVLAAGRGTRMAPLSDVLPKPALPLPGGAVVEWPLRLAAAAGTGTVVVNSWHLADRLEAVVVATELGGCLVRISRETELMDTAGGLALARERGLLGDDGAVLVVNGDCVLGIDLAPLLAHHAEGRDLVTLALLPHLGPTRWSRVLLDRDGVVVAFRPPGEPAPGEVPFLYTGAMIVARAALAAIPLQVGSIYQHLWRPALAAGRLGAAVVTGHWREVGTPRDYQRTAVELLGGRPRVHPAARIDPAAVVASSLVGRDATVAAGAVVAESVVSHGAVVGPGARVIASVVLGPVQVAAGEKVTNDVRTAPLP